MSQSDPIADMLTRIRNAGRVGRRDVIICASKLCESLADVLKREGYIAGYDRIDDDKQGLLRVQLKYSSDGQHVISQISRVSKPGRRIYRPTDRLPHILGGLGITIVSTSKGILSDRQCRSENVGGEVLCRVS